MDETSDGIQTKYWEGNELEAVLLIFSWCNTLGFSSSYLDMFTFICIFVFIFDLDGAMK